MEFETPVAMFRRFKQGCISNKIFEIILLSIESQLETLIDVLHIIDIDIVYKHISYSCDYPFRRRCKVERMFSSVKRIKTRLRSQMTTVRLSNLALLSIEKDITDKLFHSDVIEHFKKMKHRRFLL